MANRFWVGGSATWDGTAGVKWSTTSGGAGGAAVPTISDDVSLDAASGAVTVTISGSRECHKLVCTGFTGTLTGTATPVLQVHLTLTLVAGMTLAGSIKFQTGAGGDPGCTLTSAGKTITTLDVGTAGSCVLADALTVASLLLGAGVGGSSFDAAGFAVTVTGSVTLNSSTTFEVKMGAGTWTLSGTGTVWTITSPTGLTITPSTSTIKLTDATSADKTFDGGSKTYNNIWFTGAGTGAFIIQGSNTFNDLKIDTPPHTLKFDPGVTTVTTFTVSGSASAFMTLQSNVPGTAWDIVCVAGVSVTYVILSDSHAHGGTFTDTSGGDAGGNFNWTFVSSFNVVAAVDVYFDSAYYYNGLSTGVVEGLNWLIGETLGIVADGVDIGDATVSAAGKLTLPGSVTATLIAVGKRYLSYAETLRAPQTGNQDGSSLGRQMAISKVFVDMLDSAGIEAGTLETTRPIPPDWKQSTAGTLYTDIYEAPITDRHRNKGVFVFQSDRGYPATIRAVQFAIESEP